jgi:5-methylcytosine-specific restriction enzyme A
MRILVRDEYTCQKCDKLILDHERKAAHVDHILAKAKGGTDDPANLQLLCQTCHSVKTVQEDGGFGRVKQ